MSLWCEYGILLYSQSASVILLFCSVRTFNKLISHLLSGEIFPIFYFLLAVLFVVVIIIVDAKKVTSKFSSRLLYPGQAWFFFHSSEKYSKVTLKHSWRPKILFSVHLICTLCTAGQQQRVCCFQSKKGEKYQHIFVFGGLKQNVFQKPKNLGRFTDWMSLIFNTVIFQWVKRLVGYFNS